MREGNICSIRDCFIPPPGNVRELALGLNL